ncbi:MAG: hypothetical protein EXS05_16155 [Planctomycetaceae bacterium]|nr:hypothetical protein [Planctomycetaceae bacterium]
MSRRTLLTLSTAACLLGMFALYELVVSPMVSPGTELLGEPALSTRAISSKSTDKQKQADDFLADQAWVSKRGFQLQNHGTYVFFRDWEKLEDSGRVRFTPFAMIWRSKDHDRDRAPIVIICDSALVEFAEKFDIQSLKPGRIIGGALEGAVIIRGPDKMSVKGRDFRFKEGARSVWSDYPIAFTQSSHWGKAQGLELDLIPETGPPEDDKPAIAGVRTIRLVKDVEMNLVSAPKRDGEPSDAVRVTSAGSFEFDVESKVALFQKEVRVNRPTGNGQSDKLGCDRLTLIFEPASGNQKTEADRDKPQDSPFALGGDLQFRRLRAEGQGTWVTSERAQMRAQMQELTYDLEARRIALRDAKRVRLLQRNNELICPEVTANLDEDGQIEQATCRGAGKLFRYVQGPIVAEQTTKKRQIDFAGEWLKQLRMEPDPQNGLDMIEFSGQAVLSQTGRMALKADVVRIWVTPDKDKGMAGRRSPLTEGDGNTARPRKMLALGDAEFESPKIAGKTDRLEVWFDEGPLPPPPPVEDDDPAGRPGAFHQVPPAAELSVATAGAASRVRSRRLPALRHVADRSKPKAHRAGLAAVPDPVRPKAPPRKPKLDQRTAQKKTERQSVEQPLNIRADMIRVRLMTDGEADPEVAKVVTEGHVKITQARAPGEVPFDLGGNELRLWNYSKTHQVIHVSGQRAHITDRGLQLEGDDIHFDSGRNVVRVEGAGVLRLPVKQGLDGKSFDTPQTLDVFWDERMRFDGQTADFYRNVHTQLDGTEMRCEQMHVTLSERIGFSEDGDRSRNRDPEVQLVDCRDGVKMSNREYDGNKLIEIREAEAFELALDRSTGAITGHGPGRLILRRRGTGNRAGFGAAGSVTNAPPRKTETAEWDYTRIVFFGAMSGNIDRKTTRFDDLRQIVYGPVRSSTDEIDADELPIGGAWMRCKALELTQHPKQAAQPSFIEMVGKGDVYIHGRMEDGRFNAQAARVSFDQSKGLYSLFGDGRSNATIWRESKVGGDRAHNSAQRMEFNPSINRVNNNRATSAESGS